MPQSPHGKMVSPLSSLRCRLVTMRRRQPPCWRWGKGIRPLTTSATSKYGRSAVMGVVTQPHGMQGRHMRVCHQQQELPGWKLLVLGPPPQGRVPPYRHIPPREGPLFAGRGGVQCTLKNRATKKAKKTTKKTQQKKTSGKNAKSGKTKNAKKNAFAPPIFTFQ